MPKIQNSLHYLPGWDAKGMITLGRSLDVAAEKFGQLRLELEVPKDHSESLSSGLCKVYHPIMLLNEISPRISRNMFRYSSKLEASGGVVPT